MFLRYSVCGDSELFARLHLTMEAKTFRGGVLIPSANEANIFSRSKESIFENANGTREHKHFTRYDDGCKALFG